MDSKFNQIKEKIRSSRPGSVFVASDFKDIAKAETINTTLARLSNEGILRRIQWGLYEYPEYNDFLGEYIAPSPHEIAKAIARNFDWEIAPSGDNALNQLGLSTQVPATLTYACNGAYKEYQFGNTTIKFKKTSNRDFANGNKKTALAIQALKALGKTNISEKTLTTISGFFTKDELSSLLTAAQHTTAWISEYLKVIHERIDSNEEYCGAA